MNETKQSLILRTLYTDLARMLTEHHEFLRVESNQQGDFVSLAPRAHKDDAAKLVGQGGETFHAMRVICSTAAARLGVRFHLARVKDDLRTDKTNEKNPPVMRRDWPWEQIQEVFINACHHMFGRDYSFEWDHAERDKSTIELNVFSEVQLPTPMEAIGDSLNHVFLAIGNAQGHGLRVKLINVNLKGNLNERNKAATGGRPAAR